LRGTVAGAVGGDVVAVGVIVMVTVVVIVAALLVFAREVAAAVGVVAVVRVHHDHRRHHRARFGDAEPKVVSRCIATRVIVDSWALTFRAQAHSVV
jgi:hypothetical protein